MRGVILATATLALVGSPAAAQHPTDIQCLQKLERHFFPKPEDVLLTEYALQLAFFVPRDSTTKFNKGFPPFEYSWSDAAKVLEWNKSTNLVIRRVTSGDMIDVHKYRTSICNQVRSSNAILGSWHLSNGSRILDGHVQDQFYWIKF